MLFKKKVIVHQLKSLGKRDKTQKGLSIIFWEAKL